MMKAWHFAPSGPHGPIHPSPKLVCRASHRAIYAHAASPWQWVYRVELLGEVRQTYGNSQLIASELRPLWVANASEALSTFARWCAAKTVHLWLPDPPRVVIEWLADGDPAKQAEVADLASRKATTDILGEGSSTSVRAASMEAALAVYCASRSPVALAHDCAQKVAQALAWLDPTCSRGQDGDTRWDIKVSACVNGLNDELERLLNALGPEKGTREEE